MTDKSLGDSRMSPKRIDTDSDFSDDRCWPYGVDHPPRSPRDYLSVEHVAPHELGANCRVVPMAVLVEWADRFDKLPARDAAEGAEDYDSAAILATGKRLLAARSATPKPAPDVVREALERMRESCARIAQPWPDSDPQSQTEIDKAIIDVRKRIAEAIRAEPLPALSTALVPSPDRVLKQLFKHVDDQDWEYLLSCIGDGGRDRFWKTVITDIRRALISTPRCQTFQNIAESDPSEMPDCRGAETLPSATGAAEPAADRLVDWTYLHATEGQQWPSSKTKSMLIARAMQGEPTQDHADGMKVVATPPVRGDREALERAFEIIKPFARYEASSVFQAVYENAPENLYVMRNSDEHNITQITVADFRAASAFIKEQSLSRQPPQSNSGTK